MKKAEKPSFEFKDLNLRRSSGKEFTTCPICSPHRKKKRQPCVTVDHDLGKANCHHCGVWGVREFTGNNKTLVDPSRLHIKASKAIPKEFGYIPLDIVKKSVRAYEINSLFIALKSMGCDPDSLIYFFRSFEIGSTSDGRTVFPMIDSNGKVRAIQVKKFDHRAKTIPGTTSFAHHELARKMESRGESVDWYKRYTDNTPPFGLFGANRINGATRTVHLVEAPKTALIASVKMGGTWCATISKSGFSATNCADLKGKQVLVYPDVDAVDEWKGKADQIAREVGCEFRFVEWAELFEDISKNDDIADAILQNKKVKQVQKPKTRAETILDEWSEINPDLRYFCDQLNLVAVGWSMP